MPSLLQIFQVVGAVRYDVSYMFRASVVLTTRQWGGAISNAILTVFLASSMVGAFDRLLYSSEVFGRSDWIKSSPAMEFVQFCIHIDWISVAAVSWAVYTMLVLISLGCLRWRSKAEGVQMDSCCTASNNIQSSRQVSLPIRQRRPDFPNPTDPSTYNRRNKLLCRYWSVPGSRNSTEKNDNFAMPHHNHPKEVLFWLLFVVTCTSSQQKKGRDWLLHQPILQQVWIWEIDVVHCICSKDVRIRPYFPNLTDPASNTIQSS